MYITDLSTVKISPHLIPVAFQLVPTPVTCVLPCVNVTVPVEYHSNPTLSGKIITPYDKERL
ncbi:MAG: hypothetical protein IJT79_01470, partial [Ruminococcus sp.]|nr:hypothetical protein [Ruminococcus sp.]